MMEQRTLNIIHICKGNTKYWNGVRKDHDLYDAIRNYMAEECMYKAEWYTDGDISNILYEAMKDYLDHCDKPSFFMWCLKDVMDRLGYDIYYSIAIVFNAYTQVKDNNGNYINGFDARLRKLDKEVSK
jgi:hypothetical protein